MENSSSPTSSYAQNFARNYDTWFAKMGDPETVARFLTRHSAGGPALELGIGTGRMALALRAQGVQVHGIEGSQAMVDRLREKQGGEDIPVTLGDFSDPPPDERCSLFRLVYVASGTFFELPTQEAQVRCFRGVARRLSPGGRFVLDAVLPDAPDFASGTARVVPTTPGRVIVNHREVDRIGQRYISHYTIFSEEEGIQLMRVPFRYATPAELDLMAAAAGLRLLERHGSWRGARLTETSRYHVSVYELPAD